MTAQLTEEMLNAGANVVRLLDKRGFLLRAALWFYLSETDEWRLFLGTPEVRTKGPKKLYRQIQGMLAKGEDVVPLSSVVLVDSQDSLVQLLGSVVKIDDLGGFRFSRNTIGGRFIDDAYIYRLAA